MIRHTPGLGWTKPGIAPVYDHVSGVRIHVAGHCQLPNGSIVVGTRWPESKSLSRFVRINGGNRRRGVMAWALQLHSRKDAES